MFDTYVYIYKHYIYNHPQQPYIGNVQNDFFVFQMYAVCMLKRYF